MRGSDYNTTFRQRVLRLLMEIRDSIVNIFLDGCKHHRPIQKLRLHAFGPVAEQKNTQGPIQGHTMIGILSNTQALQATYGGPVDSKGQPAPVQGVAFTSTDETVAKLVPGVLAADGTISEDTSGDGFIRCVIVAVANGVCRVRPTADADMGDAVEEIDGEFIDVQVTGGKAVGFGAPVLGQPVDVPPAV